MTKRHPGLWVRGAVQGELVGGRRCHLGPRVPHRWLSTWTWRELRLVWRKRSHDSAAQLVPAWTKHPLCDMAKAGDRVSARPINLS